MVNGYVLVELISHEDSPRGHTTVDVTQVQIRAIQVTGNIEKASASKTTSKLQISTGGDSEII